MSIIARGVTPSSGDADGVRRPSPSSSSVRAFRDKSILITGASRGLGRSLAISLSLCRPRLLILSGRDEDALLEVRDACERNIIVSGEGGRVEIVVCDLSDVDKVMRLADESLRLANGVIDVLINNGGISSRSSFLDTTLDVDMRLMRVNFFSGVALAKSLVPAMVGKGGRVVWISSVQGKREWHEARVVVITSSLPPFLCTSTHIEVALFFL
jgi:dehydrogenase/reductase SDR family protein 7B